MTTTAASTARQCPDCLVWTHNPDHECVAYTGPACQVCGSPTVFVTVGAPGTGSGYSCRNGHFDGYSRILSAAEVR